MFSTVVLVAFCIGLFLSSVLLWALFLRVGVRWANVPDVTARRIFLAAAAANILQVAMNIVFLLVRLSSDTQSIVPDLAELATAVVVQCAVISIVFKVRFLQSLQAWLPTLLSSVATLAFALLVLRPFVYEAFVVPINAMAPTLIGQHWKGTCPVCGKSNYCSPSDERHRESTFPTVPCGLTANAKIRQNQFEESSTCRRSLICIVPNCGDPKNALHYLMLMNTLCLAIFPPNQWIRVCGNKVLRATIHSLFLNRT